VSTPAEKHAFRVSGETALTLLAFIVFFTALLAWVYLFSRPVIEDAARSEKLVVLNQILPPSLYNNDPLQDTITLPPEPALGTKSSSTVYRARFNNQPVGLIMDVVAPDGYSGAIKLLVAFSASGQVLGVRVLEHKETAGLGDYIDPRKDKNKNHPWIDQFNAVPTSYGRQEWQVKKDGGQFDAYAGATISPRAVVKAVYRAREFVSDNLAVLFAQPAGIMSTN
jgi:Na+-translocating ferredoxin:NAD+ oxidoreductase subunit G